MTIIRIDKYGCLTQSSGSMRLLCILATVALAAVRNKFLILDTDQGERFLVDTGESKNQDTNQDSEETKEDTTKEIFEKFPTIEEPWAKMEKNASNPELSSPPDKKHGNKTKEDTKEGDGEIIKTSRNKYSLNEHYI